MLSSDTADAALIPKEPPPSYDVASIPQTTPSTLPPNSPRPRGPPRPLPPLDLPVLNLLKGKRVILASASPRRKQLLAQIGLTKLEIIPSNFAEDLSKTGLSAMEYVLETATQKALDVYRREIDNASQGEPALIVAADTIVVGGRTGEILEKPRSEAQHVRMLTMLRDSGVHKVYTAVCCMAPLESAKDPGYAIESHVEETSVKFDPGISDELILAYVKTREGADKAGGYGIQGMGSILVERIEGTYDNVVGLPLRATLQLIEKVMMPEEEEEAELTFDR